MQERTTLAEQVRVITTDIHTLESAARILDGQRLGLAGRKPRVASDGARPALGHGAFTRAVLEVLREAERPMTAFEAGQAALARLGLTEDSMPRQMLSTKVTSTTTNHIRKGTLRRVDSDGEPYRLEVAR